MLLLRMARRLRAGDHLRRRIRSDGRPVREIARKARVDYRTLWRWYTRRQGTCDVNLAEKVWVSLTGEPFTDV